MTNQFWDRGYCVIENLLDRSQVELAKASFEHTIKNRELRERNSGCVFKALDEYSPPIGEMLLRHCRPAFEAAIGKPVLESYAYWRLYRKGAELKRHFDRIGCEISASVTLACDPVETDWPIMIEDLQCDQSSIHLQVGSGLLYQGHKVAHWREPFSGASQIQLLFHYVLKDGDFANHKFDERELDPINDYYAAG